MTNITAIGTANPQQRFKQSELADFMVRAMQLNASDTRRLKTIFNASGIEFRHSVLEDYGRQQDFTFYPNTEDFEPFPSTAQRLRSFREHALTLSVNAVENMLEQLPDFKTKDITHLIVVSCTGLYAPGLDIELVKALDLPTSVQRTGINFMGCYAAFNALKVADAFCRFPNTKVLIVCTELCSLHFQKESTEDNLLSNALFADGAAAALVEHDPSSRRRLVPELFRSDLILEGAEAMAWGVGDRGFEMKLSSYVPSIIKSGVGSVTNSLLSTVGKSISDIRHFAIHPGGRKILENLEEALGLTRTDNEAAYEVLRNHGNMSSPTILFVIAAIMKNLTTAHHADHMLCFAFGPGLTLELMLLRIDIT